MGEYDTVYWIPALANPADGLTKTKSDMFPLPRLCGIRRVKSRDIAPPQGHRAQQEMMRPFCFSDFLLCVVWAPLEYMRAEIILSLLPLVGAGDILLENGLAGSVSLAFKAAQISEARPREEHCLAMHFEHHQVRGFRERARY